jgi:short-subunit dehydrogenase
MTKFGVVGLSEALYAELAPAGVGVTVLCPTFFETDILKSGRSQDAKMSKVAEKLMKASRLDARGVARAALTSADAGKLFAVPMIDGRMAWRLKRLLPDAYYSKIGPFVLKQLSRFS